MTDRVFGVAGLGVADNVRRLMYQSLIWPLVLGNDARGMGPPVDTKGRKRVADALIAAGGTPRSDGPVLITAGPNEGSTGFYLHDPDGYAVELFERASA